MIKITHYMGNYTNMRINTYENMGNANIHTTENLSSIINYIRAGRTMDLVLMARKYGKGDKVYDGIKALIPTFTANATFSAYRNSKNINSPTGLIYIDIDDQPELNPENLYEISWVYSCWKSISGKGYGLLAAVSNVTIANFRTSWSYLEFYLKTLNINIDKRTKDITRQCVISYDPDIFVNEMANPLVIPEDWHMLKTNKEIISPTPTPSLPLYNSRTIDTNYPIKYVTTLDDYYNLDCVVIEDGRPYRNTFIPNIIENGNRHKWLCSCTSSLLFNNPDMTAERLENILYKVNIEHCIPNLTTIEVKAIVNWSYDKHINNQLNIRTKTKKIWINPDKSFDTQQKRKIIGTESGKLRKKTTINKLKELYIQLMIDNERITQKLLQEHSGMSIRTVKKHWQEIIMDDNK